MNHQHHPDLEALYAYEAAQDEDDTEVIRRLVDTGVITSGTSPYFVCCFWCQEPVMQHETVRVVEDQLCCSDRCALRAWEES